MNCQVDPLYLAAFNAEVLSNIEQQKYLKEHGRSGEGPKLEDYKGKLLIFYCNDLNEYHKKLDKEISEHTL